MIEKGQKIATWFSGQPDGMSTVLKVLPYTGAYPQQFNCVLRLSAPRTGAGWVEKAHYDEGR